MALRTQFLQLVTMLRNELKRSSNVAVGVDDVSQLKHHINQAYERLLVKYPWAHLQFDTAPVALAAGQRYYTFPTTMDPSRVARAHVWWSGSPRRIERGIDVSHYEAYDSTLDERSDPALRYDIRFDASGERFEIWPIPSADNAQTVVFSGQRKCARLVNDADICYLDDNLVVPLAAVSATNDDADRKRFEMKWRETLAEYQSASASDERSVRIGLGGGDPGAPTHAIVRVR